jgi:putative FmdB family regulatory protein
VPTYEYACTKCSEHLEVVQSFTDDALTTCPHCGGPLRKVFGSIGIVLKGSGFYKTDSRASAKSGAKGTSEAAGGSSGENGGAGSPPGEKKQAAGGSESGGAKGGDRAGASSAGGSGGAPAAKAASG